MKEISVVIPTYNFVDVAKKVLIATLAQSFKPKEIIIIDSSTSDQVEDMVKELKLTADVPIIFKKVKDFFPGEARNKGAQLSNCTWLAFLDSKTIPKNDWLETNIKLIEKKDLDVIFGSTRYLAETEFQKCLRACTFGKKDVETTPGSLISKKNFETIGGFQEKVRTGDDIAWRDKIKLSNLNYLYPDKTTLTYSELPKKLIESLKRFFIYQLYGARVDIQNTNKNIFLGLFLILVTLIVPKWNYIVGFGSSLFIPNITTIYVTSLLAIPVILLIFDKESIRAVNTFLSFSFKIALFIIFFYGAVRWNYVIADFVEDSILFIPHITKIYLTTVLFISFIYRGLYFPLANNFRLTELLPLWWIKVGILGLMLDLAKAPGYLLGAILKLIKR